jgi:hypothetical protein
VDAIYRAFSIATANTFVIGIAAAVAAAGLVLLLREAPAPSTEPVLDLAGGAPASTEGTPSAT